jgi:Ribonuclease HII
MANSNDSNLRKLICGFEHENEAYESGATIVAGLDECGRGALLSVVTAGAVILPRDCKLEGLRDSKLISPKKRQRLAVEIKEQAIAWSVAHVPAAAECAFAGKLQALCILNQWLTGTSNQIRASFYPKTLQVPRAFRAFSASKRRFTASINFFRWTLWMKGLRFSSLNST